MLCLQAASLLHICFRVNGSHPGKNRRLAGPNFPSRTLHPTLSRDRGGGGPRPVCPLAGGPHARLKSVSGTIMVRWQANTPLLSRQELANVQGRGRIVGKAHDGPGRNAIRVIPARRSLPQNRRPFFLYRLSPSTTSRVVPEPSIGSARALPHGRELPSTACAGPCRPLAVFPNPGRDAAPRSPWPGPALSSL